ncbi:MAG TPA: hypothetical protein VGN74_12130 [Brevundimonas sp.]|uniref:hypothetical protein n=1 Tax=Brevundimonas sp. TaxID=1871086 RepID=UPI002E1442C1|nr:hypothetical protein [Brevundimonas sp.]
MRGLPRLARISLAGPGRWLLALALAAGLAVAAAQLAGSLGLRWDPLGLQARRLARAEAEAATLRVERDRLAAVLAAERALTRAEVAAATRAADAEASTRDVESLARGAPDAALPLSPDRLHRLRAHDRRLCQLAPALDGCAAALDPARDGVAAVPARHPAAGGDPGGS